MTMKNDQSAFPLFDSEGSPIVGGAGLSKREYFAAMALQGYLAAYAGDSELPLPEAKDAARNAVEYADALIQALNS